MTSHTRNRIRTGLVASLVFWQGIVHADDSAPRFSEAAADAESPSQLPKTERADVQLTVYVGTYTGPKSKGIYQYDFDTASGALTPVGEPTELANPSFLTVH